jgi:two-component system, LuxR family, response regulator FixJ
VNTGAEAIVHLVDDDDAVRDSLRTLLDSYGLDVREYKSAVQFLDEGHAAAGGCLVLDLHLPILSGLDLITIMRQRDIRLPVVFITGRSDKEIKERAMRAGAVAFLDKPLREEPLMAAIHSALAEAREPRGRGTGLSRAGSAPA